uniref:Uncharacterized protein n=1 Tax=Octopus bimaculoides TaxID=37653 RepID=A0A0L8FWT6_OCTBM
MVTSLLTESTTPNPVSLHLRCRCGWEGHESLNLRFLSEVNTTIYTLINC